MANPEHVEIVKQGAAAIAEWYEKNPGNRFDLGLADLRDINLIFADLRLADLHEARLLGTNLAYAYLNPANLSGADLRSATLSGADLSGANLWNANLSGTDLDNIQYNSVTRWPEGFTPPRPY